MYDGGVEWVIAWALLSLTMLKTLAVPAWWTGMAVMDTRL